MNSISLQSSRLSARRKFYDKVVKYVVIFLAILSTLPLLLIFYYVFSQGASSVNFHFLANLPKPVGESGGGIANAIIGTLILVAGASLLALPVGIATGIYLSLRGKKRDGYIVRLALDILQGIPSIVIGIVAYIWIVLPMGKFSLIAGSIALGMMMLPVVARSAEETLLLVPASYKEAALSLGAPEYMAILQVVLPAGIHGIAAGALISIARICGETAPLLFTAFGSPFMNMNVFKPVSSLPLIIFNYAISPYEDWHKLAWGASFVLLMMVLILSTGTSLILRKNHNS